MACYGGGMTDTPLFRGPAPEPRARIRPSRWEVSREDYEAAVAEQQERQRQGRTFGQLTARQRLAIVLSIGQPGWETLVDSLLGLHPATSRPLRPPEPARVHPFDRIGGVPTRRP